MLVTSSKTPEIDPTTDFFENKNYIGLPWWRSG